MYSKTLSTLLGLGLMISSQSSMATELKVLIEGIKSADGTVKVALFNNANEFPGGNRVSGKVAAAKPGGVSVLLEDVSPGQYAIACYHDANDNDEMDTNFLGMPTEDFGFSNDARANFAPPKFADAAFEVNSQQQSIVIKIQ